MKKRLGIVLSVGGLLLGVYGIYGLLHKGGMPGGPARQDPGQSANAAPGAGGPASAPLKPARVPPAGYLEYRNTQYRFALFYPQDLSVKEYDEGSGAMTISFQDVATAQGFQIFVEPYGLPQVTQAQFKKDEPSGVMQGAKNTAIDGATATSFYSTNPALGDTAEVWFIKGNYLFEVTTLKPLASWLSDIMKTWQFI